MPRLLASQRPVFVPTRGAVVFALLLGVAACGSDAATIESPDVDAAAREACESLVDALPETVADENRRTVEPFDALGAAWGDPEIVLVCGVDEPEGFDQFSTCEEADGVGWYVPEEQAIDPSADLVMTTIGIEPRVELRIPGSYRPPAGVLVEVAPAIKEHLRVVEPCV